MLSNSEMEEDTFGTESNGKTYLLSQKKIGIFPSVIMEMMMQICQVESVFKYKNTVTVLWEPL